MSHFIEPSPAIAAEGALPDQGAWRTFRDALRGAPIDYTTAPIGRGVIMLAVPMVMEMAMESIFAVADVFWVAHLGAGAVATVGLTESMMTIIYTRRWGCRSARRRWSRAASASSDPDGAARAAAQSILLGLVVAAVDRDASRAPYAPPTCCG